MRRVLVAALIAVLLTGCAAKGSANVSQVGKTTTVCSDDDFTVKIMSDDDIINTISMGYSEDMGMEVGDDIIEMTRKAITPQYDYEGITLDIVADGTFVNVEIILDVDKIRDLPSDFSWLKEEKLHDKKAGEFVKQLEKEGASCTAE